MLAAALQLEVAAYIAQFADQVDEDGHRLVVRNGYHAEREVLTAAGAVTVRAPRVNDRRVDPETGERQRFSSAILPAWARKSPKMTEVLPLLYLHGLSSGDFAPALEQFLGTGAGLSAASITRLTTQWQDEARTFAARDRGVHDRQRRRGDVLGGGATPFRGEKDTNWEGGWRIPCVWRWPGVIQPGQVINDICSLQDFIPTFAAAVGEPDLVEKVKTGYQIGDKTYKVHLDGVNLLPFLKGEESECPREGFVYWSDDGDFLALRVRRWKVVFAEQRNTGIAVWREPFSKLRIPKFFDLRADPFERGDESDFYYSKWFSDHDFLMISAQTVVAKWLESFKEFPPRAEAASFTIDQVVERLMPKS